MKKYHFSNLKIEGINTSLAFYFLKESRKLPDKDKKKVYPGFGAPILQMSSKVDQVSNIEVVKDLANFGINIIETPIEAALFKEDVDINYLNNLLDYLVSTTKIKIDKKEIEKVEDPILKLRLINIFLAIVINYVARGKFGKNKSDRFYGLRTGQLLDNLRAEFV